MTRRRLDFYDWSTITNMDLASMHTKQLLNLRDEVRYQTTHNSDSIEFSDVEKFMTKLYLELNTREHVPNKQEAKLIRQQKFSEKKNR